jgi:hypothetical protein
MVRVNQIFEFHLSLAEVRPPVWRRIQVPADYTLARLHKVIQIVMDWQDCHLYEFTVDGRSYGAPDPEDDHQVLDERAVLRDLGLSVGDRVEYVYDFGDDSHHVLQLEDQMPPAAGAIYPVCVGGGCSAPPDGWRRVRIPGVSGGAFRSSP